ncbi:unnamed protein product [Hymenolepis diminuta]|uniref:NUC153 domain-containing protein n=1 Tax=Hymenolepis diminuta TaxID=6216 RepID=A0A0R3SAG7_HYMDI|nr:unnamed protein product [Hymenolepis diminuta]
MSQFSRYSSYLIPLQFFESTKGKIPEFNLRVNVPDVETGAAEDDGKPYDDEDDGVLNRIALKKRSEQLIEMRTKKRVTGDKGKKGR